MPLVGDRVRSASRPHRSLRRLRRRLFASAPPPMHQPSHAPGPAAAGRRYRRALQVVARRFPSLCTRPRRPPPSPPLVATLIAAAADRPPCRHGDRTGSGAVCCRGCAHCAVPGSGAWGRGVAGARSVYTYCGLTCLYCLALALVSQKPLRNRVFAPPNRQISLRGGGSLPRTPLGLAPQTPVLQVVC